MNYWDHLKEVIDTVNEYEKSISTPELLIKVKSGEYEKNKDLKMLLSAQMTFTAPICEDSAVFYSDDWVQKITKALPEGFSVRPIENKNNKYPEDSVVGEIFTSRCIGPIPKNTVVCIFTVFGSISFLKYRSCFILYDNGKCSFKLDSYENFLLVHEQCFVKELLYYSNENESTKIKLAESYIKNNTKKQTKSIWSKFITTSYLNDNDEVFAICHEEERKDNPFGYKKDYRFETYPSLSELSEFIRKSKSDATAFAVIEGYMQEISKNHSIHNSFTHLQFLPENLTFTQSAIYLNNKILVDCKKPIPEIIDDIFDVCRSSDLQLNIKTFTLFEKVIYTDLYKEIVAHYTKLSVSSDDLVSQYNKAFCGSVENQKQFFQSEFLKQAIFNIFMKGSSMLYNDGTKSSNIAAVIDLVNNCQVDILHYSYANRVVDLSFTIQDKSFIVGNISLNESRTFFCLDFYSYVVDVMADFLFADVSFDELVQEYFSLDVAFYNTNKWTYNTDYLKALLKHKKAITESILEPFNNKCSFIKAPDSDSIINRVTLEQELEMLSKIVIDFGRAKNEFGYITIGDAYCHEDLESWFKYISVTIEKHNDKYVYVGFCPAKMRRYFYIKQYLNKQTATA